MSCLFAEIIIDISSENLDRRFTYRVPERFENLLRPGIVVKVPFGSANRIRKGYVVDLKDQCDYQPDRIKEILEIMTSEETTEGKLIALAAWIRENYGSTMIQALKTVVPVQDQVHLREKYKLILAADPEKAEQVCKKMPDGRMKARKRLLEALLGAPEHCMDQAEAKKSLGVTSAVIQALVQQGLVRVEGSNTLKQYTDTLADDGPEEKMTLNRTQQDAVQAIRAEFAAKNRPILLHGVTGSGKTLVYMELIRQTIAQGRQVIVLIPEIALTYQTASRFYRAFGDQVAVLNSRLSSGERYEQFRRAKSGEISIVVGPRSALFTPFGRLGLIIIDEEHEGAYKSEITPRYHARETAVKRASMENAGIVLGSATPSMEAFYRARAGEYLLVTLDGRYEQRPLPHVSILDMRNELKEGNRSVFSRHLAQEMARHLADHKQVMLFLNRRGYAGFVSCRSCGQVIKCPHCDVSMSQHNNRRLICHYCGYETVMPEVCPTCGSGFIGGFKAGTQQVETQVKKMFPSAGVLRMDFDTTRARGSYEEILSAFSRHEADVLIGTQMIVKGHDFPDVTLVGVIAADLSLNEADFRCSERTYQLLTQAVGRAGRGLSEGSAIIQTYHPEHYSIQAAAVQDFLSFYEQEMSYRNLLDYPPAAYMMAVLGTGADEEHLKTAMHYLSLYVRRIHSGTDLRMIGPAPLMVSKVKDQYRQALYLKHKDRAVLVRIKDHLEKYIEINAGFRNIYIQFDFNL